MPLVMVYKAARVRKAKRKSTTELMAERWQPRVQTTFTRGIDRVMSDRQIRQLAAAVQDGDMTAAMQIIPVQSDDSWQELQDNFGENYRAIINAAGQQTIADVNIDYTFDIDQKAIVQWIDAKSAQLIKDISRDTRDSIKGIIRNGSLDGLTITQQADLIRPIVGLTDNQTAAVVRRYQLHLDQGLDEEDAKDMAQDYAEQLLATRAETIARTETITAQNYGQLQSFNQARDDGLLGDNPTKTWVGSEFESTERGACEDCARLNNQTIPVDDMFDGGDKYDDVAAPPLHPNCRCSLSFDPGFGEDD